MAIEARQYAKTSDTAVDLGLRATEPLASRPQQGVVRRADIMAQLSVADRELLLSKCREVKFQRGAHLFVQGSRHTENFFIRSGVVRSYYVSPSGKELTFAYWSVGDLVGGPDFLGKTMDHIWSVQAVDDVTVLVIDGEYFTKITSEVPSIAQILVDTLVFKLRWMSVLFQIQGTASVYVRLAVLLLKLSELFGGEHSEGTMIEQCFTQGDLANMVGATREWVSLTLGQLKRQGIIRTENRRLVILDHDALKRISKI